MKQEIVKQEHTQQAHSVILVSDLPARAQYAVNKLAQDEQKYIMAALQKKLKEIPAAQAHDELIATITSVYTIAGQKPDGTTLALFVGELHAYLIENYPNMSLAEVNAALRAGVYADRSEKNQYFGLNVKTFVQFIREYLFCEARQEAKKKFEANKQLMAPVNRLTEKEAVKDNKEFVNYLFDIYRHGSLLTDFIPAFTFAFLEDNHTLILSHEEKIAIKKRARSYYQRLVINFKYHSAAGGNLRGIVESQDPKTTIANIARQFAVYEFFEVQAAIGKTVIFNI